ncbi:flagellar hook-basal body protein [Paenibacillus physcomitrellae]|uniref:Flagellar hook-basal body complex protein FlhO n=1 Tax=Paenibacillus physcomitrellae TaxID=1619311 RepID=A0ABQ1GI72_9BACL|nr:flagellar hook-basal body protein [Paenibacillus physcomitrellae]GGA43966.1 flagellar hook-basal body complex protein FlhO [Paenibacillus physcomitrellae]
MLRGLYTAAAGMITQQRLHDTVTQNIANVNTTGYKQVNSVARSFPEVLLSAVGGKQNSSAPIGKLNTGVFAEETLPTFTQGDARETGKTTDFALVADLQLQNPDTGENYVFDASGKSVQEDGSVVYQPQAFFTVRDAEGNVKYTRDGDFHVDAAGRLLTAEGYEVLGTDNNPLTIGGAVDQLKVDNQGRIVNSDGTNGPQLLISVANQPNQLVRDGNGVFEAADPAAAGINPTAAGAQLEVRQGSLETSNVDSAQAMVDLMTAQRAYEANQQVIQYYDKSLDKAVNEIGRV